MEKQIQMPYMEKCQAFPSEVLAGCHKGAQRYAGRGQALVLADAALAKLAVSDLAFVDDESFTKWQFLETFRSHNDTSPYICTDILGAISRVIRHKALQFCQHREQPKLIFKEIQNANH